MIIPDKIKEILEKDSELDGLVKLVIASFEPILQDNKLFFFEEYTDHGIEHVEMVLKAAEFLIHEDSYEYLEPKEISILIFAIILHDIGMHAEFSTFKAMIEGKYDDVRVDVLDKKTWKELWNDYLSESIHWSSKNLYDIFGNSNEIPKIQDLSDKDKLTGIDKKLIGEFIRRNHARLAHEIALKGFIGKETIFFGDNKLEEQDKQFVGIIARSHGMKIRDTFDYLKDIAYNAWKQPAGLNIVYLMVLLRLADYLQIEKTRIDPTLIKLKTFNSPLSSKEHKMHMVIKSLTFKNDDPELIYVTCDPKDAQMYVKIQELIRDIQHEFDLSWAILGEIYGFLPKDKPKIKFRRIDSNLEHSSFLNKIKYVPQKINFEVNKELSKLLVAPLYGDNPIYGVRELVQNATDACKERIKIENDKGNKNYNPLVEVSIDKIDEENYLFKIKDNGKGMTLDEILNYFLSVGSSFRKTLEWKKEFTNDGKSLVNRNGKFGIGVLAAFLLGDQISVKTKSVKYNSKTYAFETNLNTDFIDINTIENFEIGTEIAIQFSKSMLDQLTKDNYNRIKWTDWYIGKNPLVKYTLLGEIKEPNEFFKPTKQRNIKTKNYDEVQWFYPKETIGFRDAFVACNDIVITLEGNSSFYYNSNVILRKPDISILDTQGKLPLSLNRNRLESMMFPFEEELYVDVCRDLIARILTLSVSSEIMKKYSLFPLNTNFLFLANGFSLDIDYFINKIKDKTILRILTSNNKIQNTPIILNHSDNLILYPRYNELNNLKGQKESITPDTQAYIILLKERYNLYIKTRRRIPQYLKNKHKVQWENDNFVVYSMNNFQSQLSLFQEKEFNKILDKLDPNIQSVQEIPLSYLQTKSGGLNLNKLLQKYIGDNIIIPYDIEERNRLYPLAFEELHNYMYDYMKNS